MKIFLDKNKYILIIIFISILCLITYNINNKKNLVKLTTKQKLEDFRYLYDVLNDNYAYFDINKRLYGYNWLEHKEEFEKTVSETKNNIEYFNSLNKILNKLNDSHCYVVPPNLYFEILHNIKNTKENHSAEYAEELTEIKPWIKILSSSEKKYNQWMTLFIDEYPEIYKNNNNKYNYININKNFKAKIIEKDKIAYLKIKSMSGNVDDINKDGKEILNFFKEIKSYPYLIIDIMGNGGGSDLYWAKNIVAPLIKDKLEVNYYSVLRGEKYSLPFYKSKYDSIIPINKLPPNNNYPKDINTKFKYYHKLNYDIVPKNPVGFNGKIYLLIDDKVFSSADSFAIFSKDTKFATLIGCTTKGGGLGVEPLYLKLPNSGLLVSFDGEMLLNSDGSSHNEIKTIPDIKLNINFSEDLDVINKDVINNTIEIIHKTR